MFFGQVQALLPHLEEDVANCFPNPGGVVCCTESLSEGTRGLSL
jgi:hypothetical protein